MTSSYVKNKVDSSQNSFVITDKYGVVRYVNNQVSENTGYSLAEIVGKKPGNLWGGNMNESFYKHMWNQIKTEKKPFYADVINTDKSGKNFTEKMFFTPVLDSYGSVEFFIEISPENKNKNDKKFKKDFLEIFSNQQQNQEVLPQFILNCLSEKSSKMNDSKTFSDFLRKKLIKPIKEKFKNRQKDKELVKQAKENPEYFQKLYQKYREDVHNYFSYRMSDNSAAYELTQDVFLKAFRYLDSFEITNASYKTYLMRIAHNTLANYYRSMPEQSDVSIDEASRADLGFREDFKDPWMREKLKEAINNELTDIQKEIIKMKYFDGLLIREISTIIQKSENAVKLHLHRGRKKIKKYFKQN